MAAGTAVVIIVGPGDAEGAGQRWTSAPGRALLIIGDPDDPSVVSAATEMAAELGAVAGSQGDTSRG